MMDDLLASIRQAIADDCADRGAPLRRRDTVPTQAAERAPAPSPPMAQSGSDQESQTVTRPMATGLAASKVDASARSARSYHAATPPMIGAMHSEDRAVRPAPSATRSLGAPHGPSRRETGPAAASDTGVPDGAADPAASMDFAARSLRSAKEAATRVGALKLRPVAAAATSCGVAPPEPAPSAPHHLASEPARQNIAQSFEALSRSILAERGGGKGDAMAQDGPATGPRQAARALEDVVGDLMRPMLQAWIDTHMPAIVEREVRCEIARIAARTGR